VVGKTIEHQKKGELYFQKRVNRKNMLGGKKVDTEQQKNNSYSVN